jgi:hypothetical protein
MVAPPPRYDRFRTDRGSRDWPRRPRVRAMPAGVAWR